MVARILVVDDNPTNIRLMEARLKAEYFSVVTASDGPTALKICEKGQCDVVLTDVVMPGMDGFELCKRLKRNPRTAHVPVIMVTRLDRQSDRVAGLEAGADDFLSEPASTIGLVSRLRGLIRLKSLTDALMARFPLAENSEPLADFSSLSGDEGSILVVDDNPRTYQQVQRHLGTRHRVDIETDAHEALFKVAEGSYDLVVVSLNLSSADGLRLCSQLRSLDRTHLMPILVLVESEDDERLMRALDLGVNDYVRTPLDGAELKARVRTQVKRKRFTDQIRENVQTTMELALTDGLTGVRNRRYLERGLVTMIRDAYDEGCPLALLMMDIDHFKAVNDTHGHPAGDAVLAEFAKRVSRAMRGIDIVARMGGEEFVVAMPETDVHQAERIGERLRAVVSDRPFVLPNGEVEINVTVSIGVSSLLPEGDTPERMISRADSALYRAKREGRNRVISAAA